MSELLIDIFEEEKEIKEDGYCHIDILSDKGGRELDSLSLAMEHCSNTIVTLEGFILADFKIATGIANQLAKIEKVYGFILKDGLEKLKYANLSAGNY